jgi:hypothetical protein
MIFMACHYLGELRRAAIGRSLPGELTTVNPANSAMARLARATWLAARNPRGETPLFIIFLAR